MIRSHPFQSRNSGFTLVELLVVVSLVVLLAGLTVPAMNSLGNADGLASGGRLVANLVTVARSEAINQRTRVQLRIVTTNTSAQNDLNANYRKISLWKLDLTQASPKYVQISKWETLPAGLVIEPQAEPTAASNPAYAFSTQPVAGTYIMNTATLNNAGSDTVSIGTVGNYKYSYLEFAPNGGTTLTPPIPNSTVYLLLAEGYMPSGSATVPVYTAKGKNKTGTQAIANWLQINVNTLIGTSKVLRP